MKNFGRLPLVTILVVLILCLSSSAVAQEKKSNAKVIGEWNVEVNGNGQYYYLTMTFAESGGKLSGTMSEQSGMFKDAPLTNIEFDGQNLSFEITVATPPDGLEKLWTASFAVGEDKMDGSFSNEQVGSVSASATREKK
jgi:hypothetical protein